LASLFEGIIITLSGLYILYESVQKLISWNEVSYLGISILVMVISFVITLWLVIFLDYAAKKTNNLVIQADLLHYKTDLYSTGGVLFSLGVIYFTWFQSIDAIVWITIAIYIIYSAYDLIKKWFLLVLDVSLDKELVDKIKHVIEKEPIVNSYHSLRTRQSWSTNFLDVDVVFHPEILLVDAHRASDRIESKVKMLDKDTHWVCNIHLDPYDDSENEKVDTTSKV
jgi:cation diffusion facilitator family transporter